MSEKSSKESAEETTQASRDVDSEGVARAEQKEQVEGATPPKATTPKDVPADAALDEPTPPVDV